MFSVVLGVVLPVNLTGVCPVALLTRTAVPQPQLCQIGYPWQYRQPYFFKPKLWTANFLFRTFFLNKILPKIFGKQVRALSTAPSSSDPQQRLGVVCGCRLPPPHPVVLE